MIGSPLDNPEPPTPRNGTEEEDDFLGWWESTHDDWEDRHDE